MNPWLVQAWCVFMAIAPIVARLVSITLRGGDAVLSVDGQKPVGLAEGDLVDVRAGDYTAQFIRFGDREYFYRNLTAHMNQPSAGFPR